MLKGLFQFIILASSYHKHYVALTACEMK